MAKKFENGSNRWKRKVKISTFADDMIVNQENPKDSSKSLRITAIF